MNKVPLKKLGLSPELMSGLADLRIDELTPLQNDVISRAIQGKPMLVKNEAGDTGMFLIPALHALTSIGEISETKILILTPSAERAKLIDEAIWAMGYHAQISSASITIKGRRDEQEKILLEKPPVLVANPGSLLDVLSKTQVKLSALRLLVIDQAQEMESHNMVKKVKDVAGFVEGEPQVILLAATENSAVKQLSDLLLKNDVKRIGFDEAEAAPAEEKPQAEEAKLQTGETETEEESVIEDSITVDQKEVERKLEAASVKVVLNTELEKAENSRLAEGASAPVSELPSHAYISVPPQAKISTLLAHLEKTLSDRIVVFTASKRTTDRLFRIIKRKGWGVVSVDPFVAEETYTERMEKFLSGEMKILLVGGMPAGKIEVDGLKQVINYDVPAEIEEYANRAGMAGEAAPVVSLVSKMDREDLDAIAGQMNYSLTELPLPVEVSASKNTKPKSPRKKTQPKPSKAAKKIKPTKNGLPRPTYDGLSGGREGTGKRPSPSSGNAFGWIKKLFTK